MCIEGIGPRAQDLLTVLDSIHNTNGGSIEYTLQGNGARYDR